MPPLYRDDMSPGGTPHALAQPYHTGPVGECPPIMKQLFYVRAPLPPSFIAMPRTMVEAPMRHWV